jgi:hypothetical protein
MNLRKLLRWAKGALRNSGIERRPDAVTIYFGGGLKMHVDIPPEIEESSDEAPAMAPQDTLADATDATPIPRQAPLGGLDAEIVALLRSHGGAMKGILISRKLDRDESYVRRRLSILRHSGVLGNGPNGYFVEERNGNSTPDNG